MAAEVIQGHDPAVLVDNVNDGLSHSPLVEAWLPAFSQLLFDKSFSK
jgi:hypothetical protein